MTGTHAQEYVGRHRKPQPAPSSLFLLVRRMAWGINANQKGR